MMSRFKAFWKKYWADTKMLIKQEMEREALEDEEEDDDYCGPSVNPSTGMPMISGSVDCMGNAFGTGSSTSRY